VISGAKDASIPPAYGRFLAERIPGAKFVELDAAHLANIEAAPRFTEEISGFFAS
jgi:pimeloyl-ACP methyl ester carboxylesterase